MKTEEWFEAFTALIANEARDLLNGRVSDWDRPVMWATDASIDPWPPLDWGKQ